MSIYRRIANLFSRSRLQREIDAELRAHIEMKVEDNLAAGMTPADARRDALLRFGNPAVMNERTIAAGTEPVLDSLARDLRYAARQLRRSPGFTVTAVLILSFAIAANVVVFGLLNAVLLRPLHGKGSERLFTITHAPHRYENHSYPDFLDLRDRNTTFSDMAASRFGDAGLSVAGAAYRCWDSEVSGNYFDMLGIRPALGRLFHASDDRGPNSAPYIVLSNAFWRVRFNGDPAIIGTTVRANGHPFTIIGVAPEGFHGSELFLWPDFWMPMVNEEQIEGFNFLDKRFNHGIWVLGKLKTGVTAQAAIDNLTALAAQLKKQNPADDDLQPRLLKPGLLGDTIGDPARAFLAGLMLLALLVLVAACANLAGIFGARAVDRSRELAIRLAIGSGRWHVLRQLLTEAMLVSLLGGLAGTLFALALLNVVTHWRPVPGVPVALSATPDVRVYLAALLLSIACGILPGLLPARQIWRTDPLQTMKSGTAGPLLFRRFTLRDVLLAVQIAACALLLTAALVALRGMQRSLDAPLGFRPENAMLAETDLHMGGHNEASLLPLQRRMLDQAARLPGVEATGIINESPLSGAGSSTPVFKEGTRDFRPSNSPFGAKYFVISPGYLAAAETRLLAGRDLTWHDDDKAPKVVLVNETFAGRMFGDRAAVGRRFATDEKSILTIVGVVENGKYDSLTEDPQPAMFFPLPQSPNSDTALVVRSRLPLAQMAAALDRALTRLDPNLPLTIHSWPNVLALVLFPARAATISLGVMGVLAAMLAITGVFGMAASSVSKRKKELGVRIALGARPAQLMRSAIGRPLFLVLAGSLTGLSLGVLASRVLAQIVYEATPRDPIVLAGVIVAMLLLAAAAVFLPARRALAISPAGLLREE